MSKSPSQKQFTAAAVPSGSTALYNSVETFLKKRGNILFSFILVLSAVLLFLQYDVKLSVGHDDALYIEAAYRFIHQFPSYFYTANAPLYPMFLTIPVSIFGIQLIWLKIFSSIFFLAYLSIFYVIFKDQVPRVILFPVLFITGINSEFIFYACMTYSECFFMFVQILYFAVFIKILKVLGEEKSLQKHIPLWLCLGFSMLIITLTKTIAHGVIPGIIFFFLINKRWKEAAVSLASFAVFKFAFDFIKKMIWGDVQSNYSTQLQILLQKDAYSTAEGYEDVSGFIQRFMDNIQLYLSKRFMQVLGLQPDISVATSVTIVLIVLALFLFGFYKAYRNKHLLMQYTAIHAACIACMSFVMLQKSWDQTRIVLIHIPFILLVIFYGIYSLIQGLKKRNFLLEFSYVMLVIVLMFSGLAKSTTKSSSNFKILKKNIKGDKFYGYTPDWVNFLQMSEWVATNVPKDKVIASRKAPMSFIYGKGREFFPIYNVYSNDADTVLMQLKKYNIEYLLLANLRRNPRKVDGYVINTIHRMLYPIQNKYPEKIEIVHTIGAYEPCYLLRIKQ